jgi:hypothetical protein
MKSALEAHEDFFMALLNAGSQARTIPLADSLQPFSQAVQLLKDSGCATLAAN